MTVADRVKQFFPYALLALYGVFMCGYFFMSDYNDHYRVFARYVFPPGLFVFAAGFRDCWKHPVFQVVIIYMAYLLLSGLWSEPLDWYRQGQKLTICLYLLSFITIIYYLVQWNGQHFDQAMVLCVLVASVAAATSIIMFYSDHDFPGTRLNGLGSLTNVNEFSNIYGIFAVLGLGYSLRTEKTALKAALLVAVGLFLTFAWFGQSRTAFFSLLIALSCMLCMTLRSKKTALVAMAILACFGIALILLFPEAISGALERGPGLRPKIWEATWKQAITMPIAGHGLSSTLSVIGGGRHFETAHNAYLQVLWHGGIIGFAVFLALLISAFKMAWSQGRDNGDYTVFCMLVFTACVMTTGVDTLIERPRDQWMLFWFPLALLLSYSNTGTNHPALLNTPRP